MSREHWDIALERERLRALVFELEANTSTEAPIPGDLVGLVVELDTEELLAILRSVDVRLRSRSGRKARRV